MKHAKESNMNELQYMLVATVRNELSDCFSKFDDKGTSGGYVSKWTIIEWVKRLNEVLYGDPSTIPPEIWEKAKAFEEDEAPAN